MRYLLLSLSLLFATASFGQNAILTSVKNLSGSTTMPEKNRAYVDTNLKLTTKSKATYYLVKKFVEKQMALNWIPNYEGYALPQVTPMGFSSYVFNYHYLNNRLAFSAAVYVRDNNENDYEFSGPAKWYNKDGSLLAEGTLVGGALDGIYFEYYQNGGIKSKKRYIKGKEFTARIHKPLLGKWLSVKENYGAANKQYYNYNTFYEDGTMVIYSYVMRNNKYGNYKSQEVSTTRLWKYNPNYDGSGTLLTYNPKDGKLMEKDKITVHNNYLRSHTLEHIAKELIGGNSTFKKVTNDHEYN